MQTASDCPSMTGHAPSPGDADPLGVRGVVPPTVTAFHEDESLDVETTAEHARFVVDRGAAGDVLRTVWALNRLAELEAD